jgi:hypothetical protein
MYYEFLIANIHNLPKLNDDMDNPPIYDDTCDIIPKEQEKENKKNLKKVLNQKNILKIQRKTKRKYPS